MVYQGGLGLVLGFNGHAPSINRCKYVPGCAPLLAPSSLLRAAADEVGGHIVGGRGDWATAAGR